MKAGQRQGLGLGMFGLPACVIPYYEAGKACNDNADYVGVCDAPAAAVLGEKGRTGACQVDSFDSHGCISELKEVTVAARRCHH